ncbi:GNAT family protein [Streptomyces buecherae]|uniref:GNAT family N-acetyltransferase n=1 Tax=Streptomyces buecherae TaxID=2763006 RepID=UPI0033CBB4DB
MERQALAAKSTHRGTATTGPLPRARGRGAGPEAIRPLLDYAFDRVWLEVFAFNDRARHAYARRGFRLEGRLRHALYWAGERHDTLVMAAPNEPPAGHG